jgi:hypothetical protein
MDGYFDGHLMTLETDKELPSKEQCSEPLEMQIGGDHYRSLAIQPLEFIQRNKLGWCEGNIVKYATRHKAKGGAEDIKKIIHYAQALLSLEYGEVQEE